MPISTLSGSLETFPHPDDRERSRSGRDRDIESALMCLDGRMFDEAAISSARALQTGQAR